MNTITLSGRLGKEVEVKKTPSGVSFANFSIAVRDGYGEKEKTYWINCIAWRGIADYLSSYAKKGDMVGVQGKLTVTDYKNSKGEKVYQTQVVCEEVELYPTKPKSNCEYQNQETNVNDDFKIDDSDLPF